MDQGEISESLGDHLATLDGWEKIASIEIVGRKHTFDLAIANTHNFVGNGIVAHNTTGKALFTLNETGDQDIFTASASGTTRLKLTNAGNLTFNQASTISTAGSNNLTLTAGGNLVLTNTTVQLSGGSSTLDVYNAGADTTLTVSNPAHPSPISPWKVRSSPARTPSTPPRSAMAPLFIEAIKHSCTFTTALPGLPSDPAAAEVCGASSAAPFPR